MTYSIINEFSGSSLFPSRRWLDREDFHSLAEKAYLLCIVVRMLMCMPSTRSWAEGFVHRTISSNNFNQWRSGGTDLYVVLWALSEGEYEADGPNVPASVPGTPFLRWLKALSHKPDETNETKRLFLRLDAMLHVNDSSLRAIRRLVQEWPNLGHYDKQLATTRLMQIMRSRMPRAEALKHLTKAARSHDLEIKDVCDPETGEGCEVVSKSHKTGIQHTGHQEPAKKKSQTGLNFLAGLAGLGAGYMASRALTKENATSGSTSAASVATVVGGLGAGFDPNGDQGIYATKKPKKSSIIRRPPIA